MLLWPMSSPQMTRMFGFSLLAAVAGVASRAKQAATNSKEQFANSPDLADALMNAIMDAFEAHTAMSSQALGSERVREGLKDTLLGPAQLYEALRARGQLAASRPAGS